MAGNDGSPGGLFQEAFELAVDGMFVAEPEGAVIAANLRLADLTGHTQAEMAAIRYPDLFLCGEDLSATIGAPAREAGSEVTEHCGARRSDGSLAPVEVRLRRLPDGRILGTVHDIQERKRAEDAVRTSENRYRALVESQTDLVCRYRSDTVLTYVNDAYCKFFGKTRQELVGQTFMYMIAPEYRTLVAKETARLATDPRSLVVGEYVNYRADGEERWIQWIVRSIADDAGNVVEVQAVGRDVTELKRTQEELWQANIVVEHSEAVLFRWRVGPPVSLDYVSANVAKFGYSAEALTARGMEYLEIVHPEDRDRLMQQASDTVASGLDGFECEHRIVTKDGAIRWVETRATIERDAAGNATGYAGLVVDVTERKLAEEDRARLEMQLNQASKMESVGRLAGGVAHDFNNMLSAILGHTHLAMSKIDSANPVRDDLAVIDLCAQRSATIVRQLLAFARRQMVAPRILDLNDAVSASLGKLGQLIGENVAVEWRPAPDLWPVRLDPSQVDQVLANLCVNARNAIAGVGTITVETANVALDDAYCAMHPGTSPGDYVLLAVSDNGRGMDESVLDHIFEPFFTASDVGEGDGLGLATVYGIVRQNDGFIDVYSELLEGTTFRIYLPRHTSEAAEYRPPAIRDLARGSGETVLLVEDEPAILGVARTMLEQLGYRVLAAARPAEALRLAQAEPGDIALLLTDVVMPEMDGPTLAAMVGEIHPHMKPLFSSGYAANVFNGRGPLHERVHFLEKPFDIGALASAVRQAIETE